MGLDVVEIFLAVEETFGVPIDDDEAANATTVGDLHALILIKLPPGNACLTGIAFRRLRRALIDVCGAQRAQIRPSASLASWMPWYQRRRLWRQLQAAMDLQLPKLEYSAWAMLLMLALAFCVALAPFSLGLIPVSTLPIFLSLLLLAPLVFAILMKACLALAIAFPDRHQTAGELARDLLVENYSTLAREAAPNRDTADEVWITLRRLVARQLQIAEEDIRPDHEWIRHLGVD